MTAHLLGLPGQVVLTIAADTAGYDIFVAAGSPTAPVDVVVIVNSGVKVGSNGAFAMHTNRYGTWPTGSTITLRNHGALQGSGGQGAPGGAWNDGDQSHRAFVGYPGGDALVLAHDITIDNTDGNLFAGGAGGTSGAGNGDSFYSIGGGGGGGGQGNPGGPGGYPGPNVSTPPASPGADGSVSAPGAGGDESPGGGLAPHSWAGSTGYTWGLHDSNTAAAYAVRTNGYNVTWLGGNDTTHVKGA